MTSDSNLPADSFWWDLLNQPITLADALHREKGKDYGHFSEYPPVVLAALNFVKAKRILELTVKAANGGDPKFESIEDSCLDQLNYVRFLYAVLKAKENQNGKPKS